MNLIDLLLQPCPDWNDTLYSWAAEGFIPFSRTSFNPRQMRVFLRMLQCTRPT